MKASSLERALPHLVPVTLGAAYAVLIVTSDVGGWVAVALGGVALVVALLWLQFQALATQAALSRGLAIGDPGAVVARASRGPRRGATARALAIYRAAALEQAGDFDAALALLASTQPVPVELRELAARAEISARLERRDLVTAHARFAERFSTAHARAGAHGRVAAAHLAWASGDLDAAAAQALALTRDPRLGPAPRAVAHRLLARIATARGDARRGDEADAAARALAPATWAGGATSVS